MTPWDVAGGSDGKIDYNKLIDRVSTLGLSCRHAAFSDVTEMGARHTVLHGQPLKMCDAQSAAVAAPAVWRAADHKGAHCQVGLEAGGCCLLACCTAVARRAVKDKHQALHVAQWNETESAELHAAMRPPRRYSSQPALRT